nr:MAG TPA: hypothetical protein [Caudoviricetes sp.]
MGTTAEKLKYLNETKAEIKNALETPYNVMRDYPELIKKYIDNQPTKVVTDGICGNAVDVPVKTIETNGNIRQETTEGYNILQNIVHKNDENYTTNGITFTKNNDGSIVANGTATANTKYYFVSEGGTRENIKAGTYRITGCPSGGSTSSYRLVIGITRVEEKYDDGNGINITVSSDNTYYFAIFVHGGQTVSNLVFKPMIASGTEDRPYEPYTGGIPSPSPDYPQEITSVGGYDNIFDKNNIISGSYVSDSNGAFIANSTSKRTDYIEIQANSYYYIYSDKTSGNWGAWYDKDKKFISGITLGGQKEGTVNSPANAKYMAFTVSYQGNLTDYSNIKINETAIKIKQSGKNVFDNNKISLKASLSYSNGIYSASDNDTATRLIYKIQQYDSNRKFIPSAGEVRQNIDKSGIYYFTAQKYTTAKYLRIANSGKTYEFNLYYPLDDINVGDYYTVVINIIDTTIGASKFKDVMLLKGKITSASYEPYHEPKITPINLQGNILSKMRDVKDILRVHRNGEVEIKKNIGKVVLTGEEVLIDNSSTSIRKWWGINFSNYGIYQYNDPTKVCDVLTTKFKPRPQQGTFLPKQVALITKNKNMYFVFEPDTTEEQARAILTDMPVYFRLAEPQTIKLSSISPIESWQGTNIFKLITNLDTDFEVEYVVDKDSVTKEEE